MSKPLRLRVDPSKSLRHIIRELITAALDRQKESLGMMIAGAVVEHLVGAKLEIALPDVTIRHKGFAVTDAPSGGKGDFLVGNSAIHVTTAPTEALLRKCSRNLGENLRPIVITTEIGAGGAEALAANAGILDKVDILEIEQFMATNVYKWSRFVQEKRAVTIGELVEAYNRIIDECETDHSLKISLGS